MACPAVSLPAIVSLANRPGPPLPTTTADGLPLPRDCFNPYDEKAPAGTWRRIEKHVITCARALLGTTWDFEGCATLLMIPLQSITAPVDLDTLMSDGGYGGFCIHTDRDILLIGLNPELSAKTFKEVARIRKASWVVAEATEMVPFIQQAAKAQGGTHTIYDDYTTRFGYRCEASPSPSISPSPSPSPLTTHPHPHPHP